MIQALDGLSDRAAEQLVREETPAWTDPMLATLADEPFSDPEWIYERKLDGERCLAFRDGGRVRLLSRNRTDLVDTYPEIAEALDDTAPQRFVLDGEIVAFDGAVTSFARLQQRMQITERARARASPIRVFYYVFDTLHLGGWSTERLTQRQRKAVTRRALHFEDPLRFSAHRNQTGEEFHRDACGRGWEGLIAKDATAAYVHGRSRKWLKLKCVADQELVIGGYTDPRGERSRFGAILVGHHDGDDLVYAGKVGTGFDEDTLQRLGDTMQQRSRSGSPFDRGDPPGDAHWIDPDLVAQIGFTEWTRDGKLRHPRFLGLRRDKAAGEVVRERSR